MARIGSVPCPVPGCGNQDASVSETPAGTLHISCHRCQISGYAKTGTRAHRLLKQAVTLDDDAATPAENQPAKPAPKATAKPPAKNFLEAL